MSQADDPARSVSDLTPEAEEALKKELAQTEEDILTLRQALESKQRHANELKTKLGHTVFYTIQRDFQEGIKGFKDSTTYTKTSEFLSTASGKVNQAFTDAKNSETMKTIEDKVGNAFSTVKDAFMGPQGSKPQSGDTFESALKAETAGQ